jgi:hypothetical protein
MSKQNMRALSLLAATYAMFPNTFPTYEKVEDTPQMKADKYVWALNQENADRKARSKNWL